MPKQSDRQSKPTGNYVFISYAREDQAYARSLAQELHRRGFEAWMDDRIDFGDRWWRTIVKAIRRSEAFVVVMTPASEDSKWVEREIILADKEGKPIFPLLLDGNCFPIFLTTRYLDVTNGQLPPDEFYERLGRLVSLKPPPPEPRENALVIKIKHLRRILWYPQRRFTIIIIILIIFATITPHPPKLSVERLWYTLNGSPPQFVEKTRSFEEEDTISVVKGDCLCLISLEYSTIDIPGVENSAGAEAYLHTDTGWNYKDLQSWELDPVDPGLNAVTKIYDKCDNCGDGCWIIEERWDRLVVQLVHYGQFGHETDDRLFAKLLPRKQEVRFVKSECQHPVRK